MDRTQKAQLLEYIVNDDLESAVMMIELMGRSECGDFMSFEGLFTAIKYNRPQVVKYLIGQFQFTDFNDQYKGLLYVACLNGSFEVLVYMLSQPDAIPLTKTDMSYLLHTAVMFRHKKCAEYLVSQGATAQRGEASPVDDTLCMAAAGGDTEMVEYLIDQKVTSFPNVHARLLGFCARASGSLPLVKRIVKECKTDLSKDNGTWNDSALSLAAAAGNLDVVVLLVKHGSVDVYNAFLKAMYNDQMNVYLYLSTVVADRCVHPPAGTFQDYDTLIRLLCGFFGHGLCAKECSDVLFEGNLGMVVALYL